MLKRNLSEEYCPIARSVAVLSDAWSFVILRELFLGNRTFEGIRRQSSMAPRALSLRLSHLEKTGVLSRWLATGKLRRTQYFLTEKGQELWPVVVALKQWGDKWQGPWDEDESPVSLAHKDHGHPLHLAHICATCGEPVTVSDAEVNLSATYTTLRAQRTAQDREKRRNERR